MKRKIIFWSIMAMMLSVAGCKNNPSILSDDKSEGKIESAQEQLESKVDSLTKDLNEAKKEIAALSNDKSEGKIESAQKQLETKVDSLTQVLNEAKSEIETLKSAEDKNSPSMLWDYLPLGLGIITFILVMVVIFLTRHDVEEEEVKRIIHDKLKNNGLLKPENHNGANLQKPTPHSSNENIASIERRIKELEGQVVDLSKQMQQKLDTPVTSIETKEKQPSITKREYATSTSSVFFTGTTEMQQETSAFVIELSSETTGEFDIASFVQIKSMNDLESFIHFNGNCRLEEAGNYKTTRKGKCEKQSKGLWKVVRPLEITITK